MRAAIAAAAILLATAAPAIAQVPGVPLPPIGPPGGPPPENPPPPPQNGPQNQPPAAQPPGSPPTGSVTRAVDPAHTSFVDDPNIVPPLRRRWTRTLSSDAGGVTAAEGKLFDVEYRGGAGYVLVAIDPLSGHDVWVQPTPGPANVAYDAGRLFVAGRDGRMRAYSPADGKPLWESEAADYSTSNDPAPVAAGGVVYAATARRLRAIRESDGKVLWVRSPVGDASVPAVEGDRVYTFDGCGGATAFARSDGHELWRRHSDCLYGGLASLFGGRLYAPGGAIFDASSGADAGSSPNSGYFQPVLTPDGVGVFVTPRTVTAIDLKTGAQRWRRRVPGGEVLVGSSELIAGVSPVGVGRDVFAMTQSGKLYALRMSDGAKLWSTSIPHYSDTDSFWSGELEVAPGMLIVTGGQRLSAYESVFKPTERGIAFGPAYPDTAYRARNYVVGVVGSGLRRRGARVRLEYSEHPFRRWRRASFARVQGDGFFQFVSRSEVNTRVRVRSGGVVSGVRTIYTWPRLSYKVKRPAPNRIRATVTLRTGRSVRLGGRRASLYIGRVRAKRLDLLGRMRLSGRGAGRASGVVNFRALYHVGHHDYLTVCVKGQARLGIGRPSRFTRGCGRRRIPF